MSSSLPYALGNELQRGEALDFSYFQKMGQTGALTVLPNNRFEMDAAKSAAPLKRPVSTYSVNARKSKRVSMYEVGFIAELTHEKFEIYL